MFIFLFCVCFTLMGFSSIMFSLHLVFLFFPWMPGFPGFVLEGKRRTDSRFRVYEWKEERNRKVIDVINDVM